jgi:hypothetical protein
MALYIHTGPFSKNMHTENQTTSHDLLKYELGFTVSWHPGQDLEQDADVFDLELLTKCNYTLHLTQFH